MNLSPAMNRAEPLKYFPYNISDNSFVNTFAIAPDKLVEGTSVHVLDEHEQSLLIVVCKIVFDDVVRLA